MILSETLASARLEERVLAATLPSGLRVRVIPKPGYLKKVAMFTTHYGSVDARFTPPGASAPLTPPHGVAHFLEHKLFEDERGDVFDLFAEFGAASNAHTSFTETSYHVSTSDHFDRCLDLLLHFVTDPYFTPAAIDKERKVIAQEIGMYEDEPDVRAEQLLLQALYHQHPIRIDITGTRDSIAAIDEDLLRACHTTFYRPDNMVLVVAGDLDPQSIFAAAAAATHGAPRGLPQRHDTPDPPTLVTDHVQATMPIAQPHVVIGYKDDPLPPGPDLFRREVASSLLTTLLFGNSSEFYETHYKTGLIDGSFGVSYACSERGFAFGSASGDTPNPPALVDAVEHRLTTARRDGLDPQDVLRLRNKAIGRYVRGFNSMDAIVSLVTDATLRNYDPFHYLDLVESITLDDLHHCLHHTFTPSRRAVVTLHPEP